MKGPKPTLTPIQRFFRMISLDKKEIFLIYTYSIFNGLIYLTLPLGVQAIIGLVMSAQFSTSIGLLIFIVVVGVAATGTIQILQLSLTELLQKRIFTRASFDFAYRIPRFNLESVKDFYAPELMNRFFDTLTVQKGLSKVLIDFSSSSLQILFGLILLSFYHPFFIFFGITLVGLITLIFYLTGAKGLRTSIYESKYKYQVAHWLEEMARVMGTFKLAGDTQLPLEKTNKYVKKYLKFRKEHFNILMLQYANVVGFKTLITGGILILGSLLVINQEINLGQFVASEIIILLVLTSAEKLILTMETVYDVLTGLDKLGQVTDIPLEKEEGQNLSDIVGKKGVDKIELVNLSYTYPGTHDKVIDNVNLFIKQGEKVCIVGSNQSGKSTLISLISGLYHDYGGSILYNDVPLRNINITSLRSAIGEHLRQQDIFHGTLEENISVGKKDVEYKDMIWAIKQVGLSDYFKALPMGFNTTINPEGQGLSGSIRQKIILARTFAEKPRMIVMDNALHGLDQDDRLRISKLLTDSDHPWTLIAVTDDPFMIDHCDKIVTMEKGRITQVHSPK